MKKQQNWEILYGKLEGTEKRAAEMLSRGVGKYLLYEPEKFTIFVLPLRAAGEIGEKNAFVIGTREDNPILARRLSPDEVPAGGYAVKVMREGEQSIVLLCGSDEGGVIPAVADYLERYTTEHAPKQSWMTLPEHLYDAPLEPAFYSSAPKARSRGYFCWGHTIDDYRRYLENMARLKLNRLVVWDDFLPVNISEIIECAHSYGIEVYGGFEWGWGTDVSHADISPSVQAEVRKRAIANYEHNYRDKDFDGIYFQSFTEINCDTVGGLLIASMVTQFVNETAGELLARYPNLKLQFGLHASSVRDHLDEIARVDKRVEIVWEDCGTFPYHYRAPIDDEAAFERTMQFTEKIITLRGDAPCSLVFKGQLVQDWSAFEHDAGPYVLGNSDPALVEYFRRIRRNNRRRIGGEWAAYGEYAARVARFAHTLSRGNVNYLSASLVGSGIWPSDAICAEIFWDPFEDYKKILCRAFARDDLESL